MRITILILLSLFLITSCDNQPFVSSEKTCEEQLFGPMIGSDVNSPSISVRPISSSTHSETIANESPAFPTAASYVLEIEKTHGTIQGGYADIDIRIKSAPADMGGFDLLIAYDAAALSFHAATTGEVLDRCEWEYFTYRFGADGSCDGGCPSGLVRIIGIAETNNGSVHPVPNCDVIGTLANLSFLVSNDRTLECQYLPIRFFWIDCGDNTISDRQGNTLFMAASVREYPGDGANLMEAYPDEVLPTFAGPMGCDSSYGNELVADIDFINGGVDLICNPEPYGRGDLNLDGLAYTIADAVMFSNYFMIDSLALVYIGEPNQYGYIPGYAGSIAASDVNADGITLGVADLVYLIRVIIGDAIPPPNLSLIVNAYLGVTEGGTVSVDQEMGAAFTVFEGEVIPTLLADSMEMKYQFDGENTRVLVWSTTGESFSGDFLQADAEIVSVEMGTFEGHRVNLIQLPNEIMLEQNYPNPFTTATTINFALPEEAEVSIWIYNNATCKIVSTYQKTFAAGSHALTWTGLGYEPGDYIFRLMVGDVTQNITMTLE